MDDIDKKILEAIKDNARFSLTGLSEMIHLSAPAVRTRLQKLEQAGYIKSFCTVLSPDKFGKEFTCFCLVQLSSHTVSNDTAFAQFARDCPDILECHRITGQYEYLLKIVTKSSKTMEEIIGKMRSHENAGNTNTFIVLSTQKEEVSISPGGDTH
jgi:Lrp/AsnC family leucine-responsive transcriptional regulator